MNESREQKLVNFIFATAISAKYDSKWYTETELSDIVQHVRRELSQIEIYTNPIGSTWGTIVDKKDYNESIKP